MPRFMLEGPRLCTIFCFALIHYEEFHKHSPLLTMSTLIRHENGAFLKRSSNRRNLKTLRFSMDEKHFENGGAGLKINSVSACWPVGPVFLNS